MNFLKTDILGGFPWVLDDFRWHHEATREALTAIISGLNLGYGNCRLLGVQGTLNAGIWTVTEGYLLIQGEIVKFDGVTIANIVDGDEFYHVSIDETFDPAGLKNLEDGGTANAYGMRRAIINIGTSPNTTGNPVITFKEPGTQEFPTLHDVISRNDIFESNWINVSAAIIDSLPSTAISEVSDGQVKYKKVGKVLFAEFDLTIDIDTATTNFTLTMPEAMLPAAAQSVFGLGLMLNAGGLYDKPCVIKHTLDGQFKFESLSDETFIGESTRLSFTITYRVQ